MRGVARAVPRALAGAIGLTRSGRLPLQRRRCIRSDRARMPLRLAHGARGGRRCVARRHRRLAAALTAAAGARAALPFRCRLAVSSAGCGHPRLVPDPGARRSPGPSPRDGSSMPRCEGRCCTVVRDANPCRRCYVPLTQ